MAPRAGVQLDPVHLALAAAAWLAGAALFGLTAYQSALFVYGRSVRRPPPEGPSGAPRVTALVASLASTPALDATLGALAGVTYPAFDVAVAVGPGAQDPRPAGAPFVVLRSPAGGKARALNAAMGAVGSDYVLLLDEDSRVEPDCVDRLLPLADDPGVWAVVGVPYLADAGVRPGPLQRTLALEARAWAATARAKDRLGLFIPAMGFFALVRAGPGSGVAWDEGALAEDTDLSLRQLAKGLRVRLSDARVGIDAPETLGDLSWQRLRWYKGMLDALWRNRGALAKLRPALAADVAFTLLAPMAPAGFLVLLALSPVWPSVLLPVLLAATLGYAGAAWLAAPGGGRGRAGAALMAVPYALVQGGVALAALGAFVLHVPVRWRRTPKRGDSPRDRLIRGRPGEGEADFRGLRQRG